MPGTPLRTSPLNDVIAMPSIAENVAKTRFAILQPLRAKVERSERIDKEDHGKLGTPPERWRRCVAFFFPLRFAVLSFWGLDGQIPTHSVTHSLATHHHTTPHPPKLDTTVMSHALPSLLARVRALARAVAVTLVTVVVVTSNCHNTSIRHHAVAIIAK